MQNVNRLLHIAGMQAARDDQFADAVDHSSPGLHSLPVKSLSRAAAALRVRRIKQHAGDNARTKAMRLKKKIAVFRHVNLLHPFSLVRFIRLNQSAGYRIPPHALISRFIEDVRWTTAKDNRPPQSLGHQAEERAGKFSVFLAVELHGSESGLGHGPFDTFHRL